MNSWLLIADLHLHSERIDMMKPSIDWIKTEFNRLQPSSVIFLGDIVHTREYVRIEVLLEFKKILEFFTKASWKPCVYLLVGNHDMANKTSRQINTLSVFASMTNVFVFSEITETVIDKENVLFIPYHEDQKEIFTFIEDFSKTHDMKSYVAFAHISINGAVVNGISNDSNQVCKNSHLDIRFLSKFKRLFAGHFHHHATYNENVHYVGSPLQLTFGDIKQKDRGFVLYDPLNDIWKLHVNPFAVNFVEYDIENIPENCQEIQNKYVKVNILDTTTDDEISILKEKFSSFEALNVKFTKPNLHVNFSSRERSEHALPLVNLVDNFINIQTFAENVKIDMKKYLKTMLLGYSQQENFNTFVADLHLLEMENFLGISKKVVLDFSVLQSGIWIIEGLNGSGKTTILDAISWCLFGKMSRQGDKDFVINNSNKSKKCCVSVKFINKYTITRTKTSTKVDIVITKPNNEKINKATAVNAQKMLTQLLNIDWSTYNRTISLCGNIINDLFTKTDKDKVLVLEKLLGFDVFDKVFENIKTDMETMKNKIQICESEKKIIENYLQLENEKYISAEKTLQNVSKDLAENLAEIENVKNEISLSKNDFEKYQSFYKESKMKLQELSLKKESIIKQIHKLHESVHIYECKLDDYYDIDNGYACALNTLDTIDIKLKEIDESLLEKSSEKDILLSKQNLVQNEFSLVQTQIDDLTREFEKVKESFFYDRVKVSTSSSEKSKKQLEKLEKSQKELSILYKNQEKLHQTQNIEKTNLQKIWENLQKEYTDSQTMSIKMKILFISNVSSEISKELKLENNNIFKKIDFDITRPLFEISTSMISKNDMNTTQSQVTSSQVENAKLAYENFTHSDILHCNNEKILQTQSLLQEISDKIEVINGEMMKQLETIKETYESEEKEFLKTKFKLETNIQYTQKTIQDISGKIDETNDKIFTLKHTQNATHLEHEKNKNLKILYEKRLSNFPTYQVLENQVSEAKFEKEHIEKMLETMNHEWKELSEKNDFYESKETFSLEQSKLLEKKSDINAQIMFLNSKKDELIKDISTFKEKMQSFTEKIEILAENKKILQQQFYVITKWKDFLGETDTKGSFRKYCISQYIPIINRMLRENIHFLDNGNAINLNCQLDSSLKLVSKYVLYNQCSQGEQKKRQLALLFSILSITLTNNLFQSKFLFMDEIFDSLDEFGRIAVQKWISRFNQLNPLNKTFIITHLPDDVFVDTCGVISVKKSRTHGSKYSVKNSLVRFSL